MAQYAYTSLTLPGADRSAAVTPTTSDTVAPDPRGWLDYENTNASPRQVSLVTPANMDFGGASLPNVTGLLAATTGRLRIGPLDPRLADPTTGLITVNIDATAGVTVAAYRI